MTINISTLNIGFDSNEIGELIMSAASTIVDAINAAKQSQIEAIDRVAADVQYLKDQVSSGNTLTPEQLAGILKGLDEIKVANNAIDPLPEVPVKPTV